MDRHRTWWTVSRALIPAVSFNSRVNFDVYQDTANGPKYLGRMHVITKGSCNSRNDEFGTTHSVMVDSDLCDGWYIYEKVYNNRKDVITVNLAIDKSDGKLPDFNPL